MHMEVDVQIFVMSYRENDLLNNECKQTEAYNPATQDHDVRRQVGHHNVG